MATRESSLKIVMQLVDQMTRPLRKVSAGLAELGKRTRAVGKGLRDMGGNGLKYITAPLALVAGFALGATAKIEQLEVSFESMLGSADAAKGMVKKLTDFTARTPFQLEGVGQATRQLLAFGVSQEDVMDRLKFLGDIAAGAEVPLSDMAAIYGKVKAKGKAMSEELQQLSDRGVPIIRVLAEKLSALAGHEIDQDAIFELASKGKISFDLMAEALESMSRKGGIFENQTEKQSNTLIGIWTTLRDAVFLALGGIGKKMVDVFKLKSGAKELIAFIERLTSRFNAFAEANPEATKWIFIFAAIAAVLGPVIIGLGLVVTAIGALISPIGLVVAGLLALGAAALLIMAKWDSIKAYFKGLWQDVLSGFDKGLIQGLKSLIINFHPARWFLDGINALIDMLFGVDLYAIGNAWAASIGEGIAAGWRSLVAWLSSKVGELLSIIPESARGLLGLDSGQPSRAATPPVFAPHAPSALVPGSGRNQVGGSVRVAFDNAPPNMRVREVRSDNPDVGIDVDAGYAIAGH